MKTKTTYIYTLSHPITNEVHYVGKSTNHKKRFTDHIYEARKGRKQAKLYKWIRSLLANDLMPIMNIINEVQTTEWEEAEIAAIEQHKKLGCNLLNMTEGGFCFASQK